MPNEEIISSFLQTAYTDERLAALLAHAQDGKLSYWSCCCFIGIPTAVHALRGHMGSVTASMMPHYEEACEMPNAEEAEGAFLEIGGADNPSLIIPFVIAEMERRASLAEARNKLSLGITNEESHSQASQTEKVFA